MRGTAETYDWFGADLAVGDLDADGSDDLVVSLGSENEDVSAAAVLYGTGNGLSAERNQLWSQNSPGVPGIDERDDAQPNPTVATGDLDGRPGDELVLSAPNENGYGAVVVLPGSPSGTTAAGSRFWSQASPGVAGAAERGDLFGASMTIASLGRGPQQDLVVGSPLEDGTSSQVDAGIIHVLYGAAGGLTTEGSQLIGQGTPGLGEQAEEGDRFGLVRE